ncbi:MAG: Gfo/Idh/MocA family oxidoreductase [Anaerolineaceae bacterium]|nr:Gfo/Idh/MocA family oxidoreductase [Anaerolineaceae bacterium]
MDGKVKVCLIGCGRAGMIHARNYAGSVKDAELYSVCDPVEENLDHMRQELPGISYVYHDYREALQNSAVDAVIVVTPTQFHHEVVTAAAKAGKHVFCEKPMAESIEECDDMIRVCGENHVKLQLGFMRRFDKSFARGKELIDSGAIGSVSMIKSNTYGPSEPKPWMFDVRKSYGPIGEVNSHDFDTIRWYAGSEVKSIHALGHNFRSPEMAEQYPEYYDTCTVQLEFENGILAVVTGAQYVKYGYDSRTEILGTKGIIKVGSQNANDVELVTPESGVRKDSIDSWRTLFRDAYKAEANAFIRCILEDTEPPVTGYDGKMALTLVHEGLRSILEKRPIQLR